MSAVCPTVGEETMHSIAKSVVGVGVVVMLELCGLQASPAAQVVISDPLTSWPLNFGPQQGAYVLLKDGAVHIVEPGNTANWAVYSGFEFTDIDASVTITPQTATGNGAGLIFWSSAATSDFFVVNVLDPSGAFAIYRHLSANGGSWQTLLASTPNAAVKSGAGVANALRIVTKGNSVSVFINGQSMGTLAVLAPSGGGTVGIYAEGQADKPADYVFSNITVSQ
jgi:3-keto-disaccharide hydrolase